MIAAARFCIVILLFTLIYGCKEKNDAAGADYSISPDSLIAPDKMVLILADVHVIEAALLNDRNDGLGSKGKPENFYKGIFTKYHVSQNRFDQSMAFYRQNPEDFMKMYDRVIVILEDRQKKTR